MKDQEGEIRIYVACLASYNNGILRGVWINADQDAEDINNAIRDMLRASRVEAAEEFAIHDYEGFEGVSIHEYASIDSVAEFAAFIGQHGELGAELIKRFDDVEAAQEAMEDSYIGCYSSVAEYAQELTEDTTDIPQSLQYYIDYDAMARDMEINDLITIETGISEVHLFWTS